MIDLTDTFSPLQAAGSGAVAAFLSMLVIIVGYRKFSVKHELEAHKQHFDEDKFQKQVEDALWVKVKAELDRYEEKLKECESSREEDQKRFRGLQDNNKRLDDENTKLHSAYNVLRRILSDHQIEIPAIDDKNQAAANRRQRVGSLQPVRKNKGTTR